MSISAVVLTKNNEKNLGPCLQSLKFVDEMIVIDDFSQDKTEIIAKKFKARFYKRRLDSDWARQRNFGLKKARSTWVLYVDSDEIVSDKLAEEISQTVKSDIASGYYLKRQDQFLGQLLKYGETGSIELLRLAKRDAGRWKRAVHEIWQIKGETGELTHPLIHVRDLSLEDFFDRLNHYSQIDADSQIDEGKTFHFWQLLKPLGKFFDNFILKQGWRDGFTGLIFAWLMSLYSLILRIKVWQQTKKKPFSRFESIILACLLAQGVINLIPVFGPELGFDALWYHLTLPKLWLLQQRWFFPGDLLYYSAMPRLGETLFIPALALLGTVGPKLIQYLAGLGSAWLTFKLGRQFFAREVALAGAALFYGTWLVGWQSGSAYIDLIRTFLELAGIYFLINKRVFLSSLAFGLAIGTKWHALISVLVAGILFNWQIIPGAILWASPWFFIAYHNTSNPLFPLFEPWLKSGQLMAVGNDYYSLANIFKRSVLIPYYLIKSLDDPLNPLLGILVLPAFAFLKKQTQLVKLALYLILGLISWQLLAPPSTRYFLPNLPILAILISPLIIKFKFLKPILILSLVAILFLRLGANSKYLPYILGQENQNEFLTRYAKRLPDTFIDSDGWVQAHIPKNETVLVIGLHNLYYLPVNFDHASWAENLDQYEYLISSQTPEFGSWKLLHQNQLGIGVYKKDPSN